MIASACTDAISVNVQDRIERFEAYRNLVKGKRVGIVANHTSRVDTVHGVDFLLGKGINVVRIFCPEHGFRELPMPGRQWEIILMQGVI